MGSITESIKELLEYLIKRIVDKPVEIEINVTSTTKSIIVQIKSAKDDIPTSATSATVATVAPVAQTTPAAPAAPTQASNELDDLLKGLM